MSRRWQDRVFKCTRTIMKHFVDQDQANLIPEIYEDEFEVVVAYVGGTIIECVNLGFEDFNVDVVRGIIYGALSQIVSGVYPEREKFTKYASMFVDIYNKGREELGQ